MRTIPKQFEKRFVTRLMNNGKTSIRPNPIQSEATIRMNANQFETKFSTLINPNSDWSKPDFQSELIRMNQRSEWFGLIRNGLIRVENLVSNWFELTRIESD